MSPAELLLIASWLGCLWVGIEIGGHICGWVTRLAARRAGVWEQLEKSLEELSNPANWRKR